MTASAIASIVSSIVVLIIVILFLPSIRDIVKAFVEWIGRQ